MQTLEITKAISMKYQRATAGFIRYRDSELLVVAGAILRAMRRSLVFTDPIPPLAEVEAALVDYQQKLYAAVGGGRLHSIAKRESKERLADLLQKLALYVNVVSNGDLALLYSSGFTVLAKRRKGQSPEMPGQPFLKDGRRRGEVAFGFKPVGRDMFYDYCFATTVDKRGNPLWGEVRTTTRSWTDYADGFASGSYVYFRVRARNRHGISRWTDPIKWVVQ